MTIDMSKFRNARETLRAAQNIYKRAKDNVVEQIATELQTSGPMTTDEVCAMTGLFPEDVRSLLTRKRTSHNWDTAVTSSSGLRIRHDYERKTKTYALVTEDGSVDLGQTIRRSTRYNRYWVR